MNWVPGKVPLAMFIDEQGQSIKEDFLPDAGAEDLTIWLKERGFDLKVKQDEYQAAPTSSASFQGRKYDFYEAMNSKQIADEFARSLGGRLLTLETEAEAAFVHSSFQTSSSIWLAASDTDQEGEWRWEAGSSAGSPFFTGTFETGAAAEGRYVAWNGGEPNDANGVSEEDCAVAIRQEKDGIASLLWNDVPCRDRAALIIEFDGKSDEL